MLSPFRSAVATKEKAHKLITSIFEAELERMRRRKIMNKIPISGR